MGPVEKTVGLVLFAAACLTSLVAYIGYRGVCLRYDGAEACLGRPTEFALYLVLSIVGLVVAGLMLHFAFRGPRRMFMTLLLATVVFYAVSILFADAGTHGWDDLEVFPSLD
jgi:uncharacterized protein (DUF983 family)